MSINKVNKGSQRSYIAAEDTDLKKCFIHGELLQRWIIEESWHVKLIQAWISISFRIISSNLLCVILICCLHSYHGVACTVPSSLYSASDSFPFSFPECLFRYFSCLPSKPSNSRAGCDQWVIYTSSISEAYLECYIHFESISSSGAPLELFGASYAKLNLQHKATVSSSWLSYVRIIFHEFWESKK